MSDPNVTKVDTIKVNWDAVDYNGSSPILSYSLEIDDGTGGDFNAVIGLDSGYLLY